jgi:hypothetical protein
MMFDWKFFFIIFYKKNREELSWNVIPKHSPNLQMLLLKIVIKT